MDLKNVGSYSIGLDLGTGSVGWAVVDDKGELVHFKKKPAWGSRIFPTAETAADARAKRGQRRRYVRRAWRLGLLRSFFEAEMEQVDPNFFFRLKNAYKVESDRTFHHPLFNGGDFSEREYYQKFPTIYHLRAWLMETEEQADLRLIYLALHNIVKARGNFLYQDNPGLSASKASTREAVDRLGDALEAWLEQHDVDCSCDREAICAALEDVSTSKRSKQERLAGLFGMDQATAKLLAKSLSNALVGYQANFAPIFFMEGKAVKLKLSDDEKVEEFAAALSDEATPLFEAMCEVYSAYVLVGILGTDSEGPINSAALQGATGRTISYCKVREYERYKADLALLKELVRTYARDAYDEFFRGACYVNPDGTPTTIYDKKQAHGYTKYDSDHSATSYDQLKKDVRKLLDETDAVSDERYARVLQGFEEERFLRRLKTSDNGSIPYQLHLEEMHTIIENQGAYYPFLLENGEKIESLVSFRIPYYVGPLTQKNAALDRKDKPRFAWSVRKPGMEGAAVYPWNWEEVIDKHGSAHRFIQRMTNECTYLVGADVLPKSSLLYEEFCVLNELNGARFSCDGDDFSRFDASDRAGIVRDLFKRKKSVSYKDVAEWMERKYSYTHVMVKGGQGESRFESKLASHFFFCHDVFGIEEIPESDVSMVETIILWSTIFEDRSILKDELKRKFGDRLSAEQIKKICRKRLAGWGRLSEELLLGLKAQTNEGPVSIMDVLRDGNPDPEARANRTMVFMEVLHDERLGFEKLIEAKNAEKMKGAGPLTVDELPGSPALRRTVNQATRIVEEIAHIAGHAPEYVFIESTREDREKGKRTTRRYDQAEQALLTLKEESVRYGGDSVLPELKRAKPADLDDERLLLYFMQNGKSMYSGRALDIHSLSTHQVDHIIPQAYIKDDSIENKVLVLPGENQAKSDSMLIDEGIRQKMAPMWRALHDAGCIGDKKFNNLMRSRLSDQQVKGFIARQLVETSQINKLAKAMLESRFPETKILSVRAGLSSSLRKAKDYVKCREINDFHHAHDALLAAEIGRHLMMFHAKAYENPIGYAKVVKQFVREEAKEQKKPGYRPGAAGFFVGSFLHNHVAKDTGEVLWDTEAECERIRKCLNYKQCYISRMPEETSGAFWDATIYSPRAPKGAIELKQGLDVSKYGSCSREQFAYFFIYEMVNKKGKHELVFAPVPVRVASALRESEDALVKCALEDAGASGGEFVRIVRKKIYKYQLIEFGGNRFYVTGKKEVRNSFQLGFTQDEIKLLIGRRDFACYADALRALFQGSVEKLRTDSPRLAKSLGLDVCIEKPGELESAVLLSLILDLAQISSGKVNRIDLGCIGGAKFAGGISPSFSSILSSGEGITFIDQSVTGMFERRTRIGL